MKFGMLLPKISMSMPMWMMMMIMYWIIFYDLNVTNLFDVVNDDDLNGVDDDEVDGDCCTN